MRTEPDDQLYLLPPREPKARGSDPQTSHLAAQGITRLADKQWAVLALFGEYHAAFGATFAGATDRELVSDYHAGPGWRERPRQTDSGLRTRRHELWEAGMVERCGERKDPSGGRLMQVWRITDKGRDALLELAK